MPDRFCFSKRRRALSVGVALLLLLALSFSLVACSQPTPAVAVSILSSNFVGYDFALAITKGCDVQVSLLAGGDIHSFNPTFRDMAALQSADLFLYTGGESDAAIETLLSALPDCPTFRLVDHVPLLQEERVEGMAGGSDAGEGEYDEHVWTSPQNAVKIAAALADAIVAADPDPARQARERENAASLIASLEALDRDFAEFFAGVSDKLLIFGDRFPFRYFAAEYGLSYYAAFPGCSAAVEPGPRTLTFLLDKLKTTGAKAVFHMEGGAHIVADRLAAASGLPSVMLHACHRVTPEEIEAGATYLSLMRENLETLRQYLS